MDLFIKCKIKIKYNFIIYKNEKTNKNIHNYYQTGLNSH
jgi:hypothetical protein